MGLPWYEIVSIVYGFFVLFSSLFWMWLYLGEEFNFLSLTPREIYDCTKLNWFGCYFLWFLEFLCIPNIWIACWLAIFFKWLFTVGRK